jgi:hypothetical protein
MHKKAIVVFIETDCVVRLCKLILDSSPEQVTNKLLFQAPED